MNLFRNLTAVKWLKHTNTGWLREVALCLYTHIEHILTIDSTEEIQHGNNSSYQNLDMFKHMVMPLWF